MKTEMPPLLLAKLYGYAEADRIANVSRGTAKRWIEGYTYLRDGERRTRPPVTPGRAMGEPGVSFADLVEVVAIGCFKQRGFSLRAVRAVVDYCQRELGEPYPLSTQRFKVGGRDIFIAAGGGVLLDVLHRRGATAWDEILGPFLDALDYRDTFAVRWWPLGRARPVVVDPALGFGLPVIGGSGVRTEIIRERFEAGDSIEQISRDFNVSNSEVESAIQFELRRAA